MVPQLHPECTAQVILCVVEQTCQLDSSISVEPDLGLLIRVLIVSTVLFTEARQFDWVTERLGNLC